MQKIFIEYLKLRIIYKMKHYYMVNKLSNDLKILKKKKL